eukprot:TRINITY_DN83791_c0_g1_i1.p1 TRINITY_DN83791_c0_g1~~TRINITY_DN83791_c0_g1_i1.p1  ORF type:complete len:254 (-),score=32.98 TRINITY_DN83791_c0_g1_i1:286-1047(-)
MRPGSWDELGHALHVYRRQFRSVCSSAPALSEERGSKVLLIPSPAACGAPAAELLTWYTPLSGRASCCFLYLHGFPDQSLDHRQECSSFGQLTTQLPRRLADSLLRECPGAAFAAFNFSGTPGSDKHCSFWHKTVSREVHDSKIVIEHLRREVVVPGAAIHVIGISTGAIIASLLRGHSAPLTITAIAGLCDVRKGLHFDFSESQLADFESQGFCQKEFWLPCCSKSNPPEAFAEGQANISQKMVFGSGPRCL